MNKLLFYFFVYEIMKLIDFDLICLIIICVYCFFLFFIIELIVYNIIGNLV